MSRGVTRKPGGDVSLYVRVHGKEQQRGPEGLSEYHSQIERHKEFSDHPPLRSDHLCGTTVSLRIHKELATKPHSISTSFKLTYPGSDSASFGFDFLQATCLVDMSRLAAMLSLQASSLCTRKPRVLHGLTNSASQHSSVHTTGNNITCPTSYAPNTTVVNSAPTRFDTRSFSD